MLSTAPTWGVVIVVGLLGLLVGGIGAGIVREWQDRHLPPR